MLTPQELTERLSLREWLQLCDAADRLFGKQIEGGAQRGTWGLNPDAFFVGSRVEGTKFDVLEVRGDRAYKEVDIIATDKRATIYWTNLVTMPKYWEQRQVPENGVAAG